MGHEIEFKMSATKKDSKIDFDDTPSLIKKKIKQAYSRDGEIEGNGLLAMLKHILFHYLESKSAKFEVKRPEKYGGNLSFSNYEEVEEAFTSGKLVSGDLKPAITALLAEFLTLLLTPSQKKNLCCTKHTLRKLLQRSLLA